MSQHPPPTCPECKGPARVFDETWSNSRHTDFVTGQSEVTAGPAVGVAMCVRGHSWQVEVPRRSVLDHAREAMKELTSLQRLERLGIERDMGQYRCPHCSKVSCNPNDRIHRYCGYCHRFGDMLEDASPRVTSMELSVRRDAELGATTFAFEATRTDFPGTKVCWAWRVSDDEFKYADFLQSWDWRGLCWLLDMAHRSLLGEKVIPVMPPVSP